jgi:hypothetical protein
LISPNGDVVTPLVGKTKEIPSNGSGFREIALSINAPLRVIRTPMMKEERQSMSAAPTNMQKAGITYLFNSG